MKCVSTKKGRRRLDCKSCDYCKHNRSKRFCSQCPQNWCIHKKHKYRCVICKETERLLISKNFKMLIEASKTI